MIEVLLTMMPPGLSPMICALMVAKQGLTETAVSERS